MKKLIIVSLAIIPLFATAQEEVKISGIVTNYMTDEPMKDCHVYLTEVYGVISAADGSFEILIPEELANENLHISHLGFETFESPVANLTTEFQHVSMFEKILMLPSEQIIVTADPWINFKDAITVLIEDNEDKAQLYMTILEELKIIDPEFELQNQLQTAEIEDTSYPGWVIFGVLLVSAVLIFVNKGTRRKRGSYSGIG